jgi:hypothetical protein
MRFSHEQILILQQIAFGKKPIVVDYIAGMKNF